MEYIDNEDYAQTSLESSTRIQFNCFRFDNMPQNRTSKHVDREPNPRTLNPDKMSSSQLFLGGFVDEGLVYMGDDATSSNSSFDEGVELLISTNGQL